MIDVSGFTISDLLDVLTTGKSADERRREGLSIAVVVDQSAPSTLIIAVRDMLVAQQATTVVRVMSLLDAPADSGVFRDAAIYIIGRNGHDAVRMARMRVSIGVPCALLAESALDIPRLFGLDELSVELLTPIISSNPRHAKHKLAQWLVESTKKPLAISASFTACRKPLSNILVMKCATANAAVGAIDAIHGPDLPLMSVNEAKLAVELSAAWGETLGVPLLADLSCVFFMGYAIRTISRAVQTVLPKGNWITRTVLAFFGTQATGFALIARHDGTIEAAYSRVKKFVSTVVAPRDHTELQSISTFGLPEVVDPLPEVQTSYPQEPPEVYLTY